MRLPVVLDIGSRSTRVGFSGVQKNAPDIIFDTIEALDIPQESAAVGVPVFEGSTIVNLDQYTCVARHALEQKLQVGIGAGGDYPLLLVVKPDLERKDHWKLVQLAFEELGVPAFHVANEPLMALYSVGLASGIVLSSGHSSSNVSTIHEGHRPPYGFFEVNLGGRSLTEHTQALLTSELGQIVSCNEAEKIKCKYGTCSAEKSLESGDCNSKETDLKDIGKKVGEMLFHPGIDCKGFHEAINRSIYLTDEDEEYEPVYYRHVMLCGGSTTFPGLKERLEREITPPDYLSCGVRVIAPPFRHEAGWIGGSLAASLPTFRDFWITKEDYAEYGRNILQQKCLGF